MSIKGSISLGIDIGSVAVKVVELVDGTPQRVVYQRFEDGPFETLRDILQSQFADLNGKSLFVGHTGIGAKTSVSILRGKVYGEIAALAAGNFLLCPDIRTVIEMGGEDSKLLLLDSERQTISDFAMNAQCAAGTGSFLDQQAGRLKISIEDEFGRLALKSEHPPRIAGRCSVFAKSDMIHLQQIATPDYDIVAGLCFAVARNFKSAIARGKKLDPPFAFEGGVAANPGMVRAFTEILDLQPGELRVPELHHVMAAVGAATLAAQNEDAVEVFDPERITGYLSYREAAESGREALSFDHAETKYYGETRADAPTDIDGLKVFLGVDVGSLSTNLVLIDEDHRVIARRYLMTEGRPIEAVRRGLEEIGAEVGQRVEICAVGTTGSGRYLTGDFIGADIVRNEITAQATAAVNIDPTVDTIFEIGGQDSKYISIHDRAVVDFEMNKACAAGTGSFLQEQAEKLKINIEKEFGDCALRSACPVGCGERCTVFMESDLVAHQRQGAKKDDIVAGLAYSIASNYLNKVVGDRPIGKNIFFQGGVAWNRGVVAAFEKLVGREVTVPPHHDVTGAIGAAILAIEASREPGFATRFKGFDLYKLKYAIHTFTCEDCSNSCEIRRVDIEGEEPLYFGSRCEKYDVNQASASKPDIPDHTAERQKALYRRYVPYTRPKKYRGRVGIPRALHFFEFFPFWRAFFESLNFQVVISDVSNKKIVEDALEMFSAETCYPVKLVYGHVHNLVAKDVDFIFLPSLIKVTEDHEALDSGAYICPYVQSIGSAIRARFDFEAIGATFIDSPIMISDDFDYTRKHLRSIAQDMGLSERDLTLATKNGLDAYRSFRKALTAAGRRILESLAPDEKVMVTVSRPYNGYDHRLSMELPEKISNLGFRVIPVDLLPLDTDDIFDNMYWRYGRRILSAARYIRKHPNLFAVYITSFGCGPDSFITHYFRRMMSGKPYVQLELDEHSADAGLITRCEAFIDSLRFYKHTPPITEFSFAQDSFKPFEKTIYIPHMCDHAYAMRSALDRYGLTAEVLDEPDDATLEWGQKFCSGKECFPCVVTTGDMIKKVRSKGFDRSRSVFLMPGATGPCRFGQYSQLHRIILDELGFRDVPIFSPNSADGYSQFGLDGTSFRTTAWRALVFVDCLQKLLHRTRPYERETGSALRLYEQYLTRMDRAVLKDESLEDLGAEAGKEFASLIGSERTKPLVGLVGEIYLRNNRFSNNRLIEKLEALGLEIRLATFTEWPLYTSVTYRRDSLISRNFKGIIHSNLQLATQQWQEHRLFRAFGRHFPIEPEDSPVKVMKRASRYMPLDVKGEAILSIGKAIEMVDDGASGVVNAMPFNCMPGTVVSSLSKRVSDDLGGVPWLNISYEGLQDSSEETRLEAFADQVRSRRMALKSEHSG